MQQETKSKLNKPLTFWQRLAIAKKYRLKTEEFMKTNSFSFIKERCGVTSLHPELNKFDVFMGYLHYEAGLSLHQISNDIGMNERETRSHNEELLKKLNIKTSSGS